MESFYHYHDCDLFAGYITINLKKNIENFIPDYKFQNTRGIDFGFDWSVSNNCIVTLVNLV